MKKTEYDFREGDYVYCTKIPGIHRIIRCFRQEEDKPPMLILEHLYDNKYNKIIDKPRDREYTVDGGHCKSIDLKKLLSFEEKKFDNIKKVINGLSKNDSRK
jgi:hypothetical protein